MHNTGPESRTCCVIGGCDAVVSDLDINDALSRRSHQHVLRLGVPVQNSAPQAVLQAIHQLQATAYVRGCRQTCSSRVQTCGRRGQTCGGAWAWQTLREAPTARSDSVCSSHSWGYAREHAACDRGISTSSQALAACRKPQKRSGSPGQPACPGYNSWTGAEMQRSSAQAHCSWQRGKK